jgi:hypothetical protein
MQNNNDNSHKHTQAHSRTTTHAQTTTTTIQEHTPSTKTCLHTRAEEGGGQVCHWWQDRQEPNEQDLHRGLWQGANRASGDRDG